MSKKKKKSNKLFIFIFILGLAIMTYPMISNWYYRIESNNQVADYKEARDLLSDEEIGRRIRLAKIYNDNLGNVTPKDPYSEEEKHKAIENYAQMLELRTKIGVINIPSIDVELPIYAGTNEEILQKGAGHLEGTSLPIGGESTHTVITAHSGLPTARLFTDLQKVKMGEKFYIENIAGTLAYEVDHIDVIDPSDFQQLLVVPGKDYATLLTCTPIMINTHRLIVRGHRVPYVPEVDEKVKEDKGKNLGIDKRLIILLFFAIIILGRYLLSKRKKKLAKKRELERAKNIEMAKMNIDAKKDSFNNLDRDDGNSGKD
ncbi:class C sortase [uncultured Peptoniphilus sp.]|uniref:class C sortase n=1 Tax=uncultured Peptoniphilus sp. TaxID=254354 RepID=UPI00258433C0|nr:class C sortase [uncultured Peptoniphilus sp.]MDU6783118.1 class C sortase [Peptoniphilus harei]